MALEEVPKKSLADPIRRAIPGAVSIILISRSYALVEARHKRMIAVGKRIGGAQNSRSEGLLQKAKHHIQV